MVDALRLPTLTAFRSGVESGQIGRRSALIAEKGLPVVIEVAKVHGDIDSADSDRVQPGVGEQRPQRIGPANRKALGLIELGIVQRARGS